MSDPSIRAGFVEASEFNPELAGKPLDATHQWELDKGLDLASPGKPYRFTFDGVNTFDL